MKEKVFKLPVINNLEELTRVCGELFECDVISIHVGKLREIIEAIGVVKYLSTCEGLKYKKYKIVLDPNGIILKEEYAILSAGLKGIPVSYEIVGRFYKDMEEVYKECDERLYLHLYSFFKRHFNGFEDPSLFGEFYKEGISLGVFGKSSYPYDLKNFSDICYGIDYSKGLFPKYIVHTRLYKKLKGGIDAIENKVLNGEIKASELEGVIEQYICENYHNLMEVGRYMTDSVYDMDYISDLPKQFAYSLLGENNSSKK